MKMNRHSKPALQAVLLVCLFPAVLSAQVASPSPPKPASLSGTVTNSVTGEPIAHAHIRLDAYPHAFGAITLVDGHFSMNAVPPGTYTIFAEHRGYRSTTGREASKPLEIKSGEKITDLVVQLVPDAVISGRVLDSNGSPLDNIRLLVISAGQTQYAATDDRGEFRVGGLGQGWYLLKAMSFFQGLPPEIRTDGTAETRYAPTYYPSATMPRSAVPVPVRAGQDTAGIDIKMAPSPILHVSGFVSNVPEGPWQNVVVSMPDGPIQNQFRVGPEMKFTIWGVPPGQHQLFAQYLDSKGKHLRSASAEINITTTSFEGLNLTLSQPLELDGHTDVEGGASFDRRKVRPFLRLQPLGSIEHAGQDVAISFDGTVGQHAIIASDGTFKIQDIFPGRYYIIGRYLPSRFYVKSARVGTVESHGSVLDLRGMQGKGDLTVVLGANAAEISGIVRDAKGSVGGVHVAMFFDNEYGSDLFDLALSGADGTYSFHGVPPGKYRLLAWDAPSWGTSSLDRWTPEALALYQSVIESVDASEGDNVSQDLKLLGVP
jgi:hypothetical protein